MRGAPSAAAGKAVPGSSDLGTRDRLVAVAAGLFAERGFKRVTVREICRAADANVAAVNYYFGDKEGLYEAVIQLALAVMRETNDLTTEAGRGTSAEARLAAFIRVLLVRLAGRDRLSWVHKLMARELEQPGEFWRLVVREVLEPRIDYLSGLVSEISALPPDAPRVFRAVLSIQAQCMVFSRPQPPDLPAAWRRVPLDAEAAADHIAAFSLAAIHTLARQPR